MKNRIVISLPSVLNPGPYSMEKAKRLLEQSVRMGEVITNMLEGENIRPFEVVGDVRRGEGYIIMLKKNRVEVRKAPIPPGRGEGKDKK